MRSFERSAAYLLLIPALGAMAQAQVGSSFLQPIGGRAIGMGEAYSTAEEDVWGIHYNPAVRLSHRQASMVYQEGFGGDKFGLLGVGVPVPFGKVAASLLYYTAGTIDLTDYLGNTRSVNAQTDYMATTSASWDIMSAVALGANAKVLRSELVEEFKATAFVIDLGAIVKPTPLWALGVSVQNLGHGLRYVGSEEGVTKILRAGVSYKMQSFPNSLLLAMDGVRNTDENRFYEHLGVEYSLGHLIALRLGYRFGYDSGRFSTGFGLSRDIYSVDYAIVPDRNLGPIHKASFAIRF